MCVYKVVIVVSGMAASSIGRHFKTVEGESSNASGVIAV